MFRILSDRDQNVTAYTGLAAFTPFGVQFRYEAYEEMCDPAIDRSEALEHVRLLFNEVESLL